MNVDDSNLKMSMDENDSVNVDDSNLKMSMDENRNGSKSRNLSEIRAESPENHHTNYNYFQSNIQTNKNNIRSNIKTKTNTFSKTVR